MYDNSDNLISTIWVWESGYIGFENNKEYSLNSDNMKKLRTIITK
jgi:hypothetical protein